MQRSLLNTPVKSAVKEVFYLEWKDKDANEWFMITKVQSLTTGQFLNSNVENAQKYLYQRKQEVAMRNLFTTLKICLGVANVALHAQQVSD